MAVANETVLVGASTGPYTERAAIYRKPLKSSGPFQRCNGELPEWFSDNVDTSCLAASGPWVAAGSSDGVVFLSPDEGESWDLVADGLPSVRCVELAR